jgi:hypothetical protein
LADAGPTFDFPDPEPLAEGLTDGLSRELGLSLVFLTVDDAGLPDPLRGADTEAGETVFVRLHTITVGGDFDSNGSEEVVVFLEHGEQRRRLADHDLDLPSDSAKEYEVRDTSPFIELPLAATALDVTVQEEDVTEWETMTGASDDVALDPAALGESPQVIRVRLDTIRGESWGLFRGSSEIKIKGAWLSLEAVRVPRRDAADDEARQRLAALLEALPATIPADAPGRSQLAASLAETAEQAARLAGASTHTWLRARLAELVPTTRRVARYALGSLAALPEVRAVVLANELQRLREAKPAFVPLQEPWQVIVDVDASAVTEDDLSGLLERARALEALADEHDDEPGGFEVWNAASELATTLEGLQAAPASQALLEQGLPALHATWSTLADR